MYPIKNEYERSLKSFFKACAHDRYFSRDFIVGSFFFFLLFKWVTEIAEIVRENDGRRGMRAKKSSRLEIIFRRNTTRKLTRHLSREPDVSLMADRSRTT